MTKHLRRFGRWTMVLMPLVLLAVLLLRPSPVLATTITPGANTTPTPECWCQYECPSCSYGASIWTDAGVNVLTREFRHFQPFPGCYGAGWLGTAGRGARRCPHFEATVQAGTGPISPREMTFLKAATAPGRTDSAQGHPAEVLGGGRSVDVHGSVHQH